MMTLIDNADPGATAHPKSLVSVGAERVKLAFMVKRGQLQDCINQVRQYPELVTGSYGSESIMNLVALKVPRSRWHEWIPLLVEQGVQVSEKERPAFQALVRCHLIHAGCGDSLQLVHHLLRAKDLNLLREDNYRQTVFEAMVEGFKVADWNGLDLRAHVDCVLAVLEQMPHGHMMSGGHSYLTALCSQVMGVLSNQGLFDITPLVFEAAKKSDLTHKTVMGYKTCDAFTYLKGFVQKAPVAQYWIDSINAVEQARVFEQDIPKQNAPLPTHRLTVRV